MLGQTLSPLVDSRTLGSGSTSDWRPKQFDLGISHEEMTLHSKSSIASPSAGISMAGFNQGMNKQEPHGARTRPRKNVRCNVYLDGPARQIYHGASGMVMAL